MRRRKASRRSSKSGRRSGRARQIQQRVLEKAVIPSPAAAGRGTPQSRWTRSSYRFAQRAALALNIAAIGRWSMPGKSRAARFQISRIALAAKEGIAASLEKRPPSGCSHSPSVFARSARILASEIAQCDLGFGPSLYDRRYEHALRYRQEFPKSFARILGMSQFRVEHAQIVKDHP
jgi:hypothetical protein